MNQHTEPAWLFCFRKEDSGVHVFFNQWGKDADEALQNVATQFFDAPLSQLTIDSVGEGEIERDDKITFPSGSMRLLRIARFPSNCEGMMEKQQAWLKEFPNG